MGMRYYHREVVGFEVTDALVDQLGEYGAEYKKDRERDSMLGCALEEECGLPNIDYRLHTFVPERGGGEYVGLDGFDYHKLYCFFDVKDTKEKENAADFKKFVTKLKKKGAVIQYATFEELS